MAKQDLAQKKRPSQITFGTFRRLARDSHPYLLWYILIALSLLLSAFGSLAVTDALRRLVDAAAQRSLPALWVGLGLGLSGFAIATFFSIAANYMRAYIDQTSALHKQNQLVAKIHHVHYDYCTSQHSGDLITRLTSNAYEAHSGLNGALVDAVRNSIEAIATLSYLIWLSWQLALCTLIPAALAPVCLNLASSRIRRLWAQRWQQEGDLSALVQDGVQGGEITRAHSLQHWLLTRFDQAYAPLMRTIRATEKWSQVMQCSGMSAFLVGLFFVLGFGGSMAVHNLVTVGTITAFLVSFERLTWPINGLLSVWPNLQKSLSAAQRVYELLDAPNAPGVSELITHPPMQLPTESHPIELQMAAISIKAVSFRYPGRSEETLRRLSLRIPGNQFTAIVGETGSGKTTILRLLLRLYAPDSGSISLVGCDGSETDLTAISIAQWRSFMGYVPQDVSLFSGTLAENIALGAWQRGAQELTSPYMQQRLMQAVKLAYLDELVQRLPDGLQTVVGERGAKLSGGERQRVALARAALRNPAILLLDEATSSLDNRSERLVQEALLRVSAGRTTVAIAHRLSTVMHADQILLMESGQICEQGTHEELMRLHGRYHTLFNAGQLTQSTVDSPEPNLTPSTLSTQEALQ